MSVLYQKGFMPTFSLTAKIAWGCRFHRKNCCWRCCFQLLTCVGSYILDYCSKWGSWKNILFWRIIFSWVTSGQIFPAPPSSHSKYNLYFMITLVSCASHNRKRKSLQKIQKVIQRKHNLWFIWNDIFFTDYGFGFICFS
jgi:hypothetical protein